MRFWIAGLLFLVALPAHAQVEGIHVTFLNPECILCFKTSQVMISQLGFVRAVTPDAQSAGLSIAIKPNQSVVFREMQERILANGAKVQMEISASGKIVEGGGQFWLMIPRQSERFLLEAPNRIRALTNLSRNRKNVHVKGTLQPEGPGFRIDVRQLQPF